MIYGKSELIDRVMKSFKNGHFRQAVKDLVDSIFHFISQTQTRHTEEGYLNLLLSHNLQKIYNKPFTEQPAIVRLQVYKMKEIEPGNGQYFRHDIPFYYAHNFPALDKFEITIDSEYTSDLTGVIVEFEFKARL